MPAYHSSFVHADQVVGNMAILPFRTQFRGPAPPFMNGGGKYQQQQQHQQPQDIIDEALYYFKSNVFFRTYEIKSEADRLLIYITLYISECLKRLLKCPTHLEAQRELMTLATGHFDVPGDAGFPLNPVYSRPETAQDVDFMRRYLTQLRMEVGVRLIPKVYHQQSAAPTTNGGGSNNFTAAAGGVEGKPSKWWLCFARRRFMDKSLSGPN